MRVGSPAWGLNMGLTTTHHKKIIVIKYYTGPQALIDSLDDLRKGK
jgi:hypothetical protein